MSTSSNFRLNWSLRTAGVFTLALMLSVTGLTPVFAEEGEGSSSEESDERVAQDIRALGDSVTIIDDMIAASVGDNLIVHGYLALTAEERLDTIDRNVRHIETMLTRQRILDSGENLKPFHDAVARGRGAIGEYVRPVEIAETNEERVAQDIRALGDSVTIIDDMIAASVGDNLIVHGYLALTAEERLDTIDRNVRHIETMLTRQRILDSGENLKPFHDAVARGRGAIASFVNNRSVTTIAEENEPTEDFESSVTVKSGETSGTLRTSRSGDEDTTVDATLELPDLGENGSQLSYEFETHTSESSKRSAVLDQISFDVDSLLMENGYVVTEFTVDGETGEETTQRTVDAENAFVVSIRKVTQDIVEILRSLLGFGRD